MLLFDFNLNLEKIIHISITITSTEFITLYKYIKQFYICKEYGLWAFTLINERERERDFTEGFTEASHWVCCITILSSYKYKTSAHRYVSLCRLIYLKLVSDNIAIPIMCTAYKYLTDSIFIYMIYISFSFINDL